MSIRVMNPNAAAGVPSYVDLYTTTEVNANFGGVTVLPRASFPNPGNPNELYIDSATADAYYWNSGAYIIIGQAKFAQIESDIDALEDGLAAETARAIAAEQAESTARQSQDNILDAKINTEIARATGREDVLHSEIDTERTRAIGEENRIETKLDNHAANSTVHVSTSDRLYWDDKADQAALAQEVIDRQAADVALAAADAVIANNLANEITNRTIADATEAAARQAADTTEQTRATTAEGLLSDRIDTEATARQTADDAHDDRLEALEVLQPTKADKHVRTIYGQSVTETINFPHLLLNLDSANPIPAATRLILANLAATGELTFSNKDLNDLLDRVAGGTMVGSLIMAHDPVQPLEPATKNYVDQIAAELAASTLTFRGYISELAPIKAADPAFPNSPIAEDLRDGNYWYADSGASVAGYTPDLTFPWAVHTWNDAAGEWSAGTVPYTPDAFDLWSVLGDSGISTSSNAFYYLASAWEHNDFGADAFNNNHFTLLDGILSIKNGAITDLQIADGAAIQISKIAGLVSALNNKMERDTGAISGNIPIFDNNPRTGDVKDSGYTPTDFELSYSTLIAPGAYHSVAELATVRQVGVYTIMPADFVSYPDLPPGVNTALPFVIDIKQNAAGTGCFIRGRQSDGGYYIAYCEYNNPLKVPGFIKLATMSEVIPSKYVHIPDGSYTLIYQLLKEKGPGLYYVNDIEHYTDRPAEVTSGHFYIDAMTVTDNTRVIVMGRVPAHPGVAGQLNLKPKFFITDGSLADASQLVTPWEVVLTSFNGVKKIHDRIDGYTSIGAIIEDKGAVTGYVPAASLPPYTDLHDNMVTTQALVLDIRNIGDTLFEVMASQNTANSSNNIQQNLSFIGFYSTAAHSWSSPLRQLLTEKSGVLSTATLVADSLYTTLVAAICGLGVGYWQISASALATMTDKYIGMSTSIPLTLQITESNIDTLNVNSTQVIEGHNFTCIINKTTATYTTPWLQKNNNVSISITNQTWTTTKDMLLALGPGTWQIETDIIAQLTDLPNSINTTEPICVINTKGNTWLNAELWQTSSGARWNTKVQNASTSIVLEKYAFGIVVSGLTTKIPLAVSGSIPISTFLSNLTHGTYTMTVAQTIACCATDPLCNTAINQPNNNRVFACLYTMLKIINSKFPNDGDSVEITVQQQNNDDYIGSTNVGTVTVKLKSMQRFLYYPLTFVFTVARPDLSYCATPVSKEAMLMISTYDPYPPYGNVDPSSQPTIITHNNLNVPYPTSADCGLAIFRSQYLPGVNLSAWGNGADTTYGTVSFNIATFMPGIIQHLSSSYPYADASSIRSIFYTEANCALAYASSPISLRSVVVNSTTVDIEARSGAGMPTGLGTTSNRFLGFQYTIDWTKINV